MRINNPSTFFTKKGLIITGAVIVVLIALAVGGWSIAATQAETAFAASLVTSKQTITTQLADGSAKLKEVLAKGDPTQTIAHLQHMASDLESSATNLPVEQTIIDIPLVSSEHIGQRNALKSKISDLAAAFKNSAELINYEHTVVEPLLAVRSLTGKNADEQTKLAASWQGLVDQLQGMAVPAVAQTGHAKLIQSVQGVQTILASLPALFTKKDEAGFTAKSKQLDAAIANLQSLSQDFSAVDTANDKILGEKFLALQEAVK